MNKNKSNFWKNRNVCVTGANGFLGSWLTRQLVQEGAKVVCLIRDCEPRSFLRATGTDSKITIVYGELENYPLIERLFNEYEIETCFHLAAQAIVTTANRFPISTFESNIRGTWNILEAARQNPQLKRLVVASSDKAYGAKEKMPYTEEATLEGTNPYDFSKTCTDLMAQMYFKSYGTPVAIARCGNLYGPGDINFDRIVPGTIRSLIQRTSPIIRSDGTYLRDYFYVQDGVNAFFRLAEEMDRIKGQAFNFGTELPTSVIDVVNQIIKVSGIKNISPKILSIAKGEIKVQYLSCSKARKILDWQPKFLLKDTLKNTYQWYQKYLRL